MTGRSVPEWVGKTPDTPVPDRVRVRVFLSKDGRCHRCTRKINAGAGERWTCEHLTALINWRPTEAAPHGNRESNLDVTCDWCLPEKNAEDVAEKATVYRKRKKHLGVRKPSRMLGSRNSKVKKKIDGSVVLR